MRSAIVVLGLLLHTATASAAEPVLTEGKPAIQSLGHLAFAPDGVLLIGDSAAGAIWAVDLGDRTPRTQAEPLKVDSIDRKIAALIGTTADEVLVHDLAVNPISQNVYVSVSRSLKKVDPFFLMPNEVAYPKVLIRITPDAKLQVVSLAKVRFARAALPDPLKPPPAGKEDGRMYTVSDLHYADGKVYVAGMSNQEFSSTFRIFDYPFTDSVTTTSVEIWHGSRGRFETDSPIQTFVPYVLNGKPQLLASYTCTPIVSIPLTALKPGAHVKGTTIAEVGSWNVPTDIVSFEIEGKRKLVLANNRRPMMVFEVADLEAALAKPITTQIEPRYANGGAPFHTPPLNSVEQIDVLNAQHLVVLMRSPTNGHLNLFSEKLARL